jgi:DNA-binding transcriptional MerR regulator
VAGEAASRDKNRFATTAMGKPASEVDIPDKLYFPIREVARIIGVEPYVLRFWEKEFPLFHPGKAGSGHRRYRRQDIEMALEIKRLLYEQGFTIEGARNQFKREKSGIESAPTARRGKQSSLPFSEPPYAALGKIRRELNDILTILAKT